MELPECCCNCDPQLVNEISCVMYHVHTYILNVQTCLHFSKYNFASVFMLQHILIYDYICHFPFAAVSPESLLMHWALRLCSDA